MRLLPDSHGFSDFSSVSIENPNLWKINLNLKERQPRVNAIMCIPLKIVRSLELYSLTQIGLTIFCLTLIEQV